MLALMIVVPVLNKLALPLESMLATAGFDELHCTWPAKLFALTVTLNCNVEFASCLGLPGEIAALLDPAAPETRRSRRNAVIADVAIVRSKQGIAPSWRGF